MSAPNVGTDVLRTLHRIHRQLTDLRDRLERGPRKTAAADRYVENQKTELESTREQSKQMRMASDAKQVQLKGGEDKIVELKTKLNTAGSNREYQALKDQIAAQEMTNSVLADEILEGMDRIEEFQSNVAEAEASLKAAEEKLAKVASEVQEQEPLIRADVERLEGELKEAEADLPGDVRELYERGVRQRGEDALAAVENQNCNGCYQNVPLNLCAEIMMGKPVFCKSCGRLLYAPEDGSAAGS